MPVIEYKVQMAIAPFGKIIRVYEDGCTQIEGIGIRPAKNNELELEVVDGKILKQFYTSSERIKEVVEKIKSEGFFDLCDRYCNNFGIFDGVDKTYTLNYEGKSKTVKCENCDLPIPINKIMKELGKLSLDIMRD